MDDNALTPYYLDLGTKIVKDLDGLNLLRTLSPEHYQAMAEYIGETIRDEVDYALRSHERSMARRERLVGHTAHPEPLYTGENLIVPSATTTDSPYVPTSEVVCRCADNRFCPVHDVQSSYTADGLDMTTPDGQAEFQRECEQDLWEIVNHPNFLELVHRSGSWKFGTVRATGGTSPELLGVMDIAERVLKGSYDNDDG